MLQFLRVWFPFQAQESKVDVNTNKGIFVDLLDLLFHTPKDASLKSLIFINQIEDEIDGSLAVANNTKNFFVLLKEYLHASLEHHYR